MKECTAQMKYRFLAPAEASVLTTCENVSPRFSENHESPFLLVVPSVSQPGLPAFTGLIVISSFLLRPCHLAIARQMPFGVKQPLRAPGVFGSDSWVTSESVCGPTFLMLLLLTTFSVSPWATVFGPTNFGTPLTSFIVIVAVAAEAAGAATSSARTGRTRTRGRIMARFRGRFRKWIAFLA